MVFFQNEGQNDKMTLFLLYRKPPSIKGILSFCHFVLLLMLSMLVKLYTIV